AQEVHRHVDSPHQVDREMVKQHIGQFKYMEPNEHIELTYCLPDDQNQLKWLMSRETIFKTNAQGKPAQILGITQDITSMKKAKQRLETFKNGLRALKLISSDTSLDFDTQLKNAIRFITNYWGMDLGIIADVEDDVFKVINSFSLNEQYKLNGVRHFNATNKRFIHQDALGITSMSDSTPHTHPCFSHLPVTSYIGCDYWVNGKRAGMINIISTSDKSMHFGAYDMDFIRLFAKWVGFTLERANSTKKLKNLNESKDRILATVAHDLRSPINSIKGTMAVMKHQLEDRIETEDQELFDLIEDSCSKTLSLIQELLDISEMENENYRLITEQVPINPFIEKTLKPYHEKINTKQVSLQLYLEETEKTLVKINRQKFARVIENLTSNALKFTPKTGNISICTSLSKDQVNIIISDTGIGIPEKLHPFIFNKFSNARRAGLQGEKSTGLGMAIVKQIIHLHQGAITFKSAENQGTMFTISLPLL
ncbi:MAG: GAF domain-containing sensor histidine kinase, partial [Flammeovirgaceae bacterium]